MKLTFHLDPTLYDCILRLRGEGGFATDYRMTDFDTASSLSLIES